MNDVSLKNRLAMFLVVAHFGVLLLVVLFWLLGNFLTDEMTTALAIIAPFFAAYTTVIVRHIVESRHRVLAEGRPVTPIFAFMAFMIPGVFVLVVAGAVVLKAFNVALTSFEDFKLMLSAAETVFGVYVGQLIFSLFDRGRPRSGAPPGPGAQGRRRSAQA